MAEGQKAAVEAQLDIKALIDAAVSERMNEAMKAIDALPAKAAGYVTQDGGSADKTIKNFGDFLKAVQRGDEKRLETVYGVKALTSETGAAGGYTVPTEFYAELMRVADQQSPIVQRVRRMPVSAQAGEIPALDQFTAPTAGVGNTAIAGRLTTAKRAEAGAFTETGPQFEMVRYRINDAASGYVKVSKELLADSAISIEPLLRELIGTAVASKIEHYILNGHGVGEPLGILNAPAKVDVAPDTNAVFVYADAAEMLSRFKALNNGSVAWIYHPSLFPDIAAMNTSSSSPVTWTTDLGATPRQVLLGYPLIQSQHSPQADASGCILLADLSAYLLFEKGGLYIDYSRDADFLNGNDVWRFGYRMDGQPWLKSAITLGGAGSAFTQSPFVNFND